MTNLKDVAKVYKQLSTLQDKLHLLKSELESRANRWEPEKCGKICADLSRVYRGLNRVLSTNGLRPEILAFTSTELEFAAYVHSMGCNEETGPEEVGAE